METTTTTRGTRVYTTYRTAGISNGTVTGLNHRTDRLRITHDDGHTAWIPAKYATKGTW